MRVRCTGCNRGVEVNKTKGWRLSNETCPCGGTQLVKMKSQLIIGECPVEGYTRQLFGKRHYTVYYHQNNKYLFNHEQQKFIPYTYPH